MSKWQDIVTYNNLRYPYLSDTPQPNNIHVLSIGDELIIPLEQDGYTLNNVALRRQDLDAITSYSLGRDLYLVNLNEEALKSRGQTDELFSLATSKQDLRTVYGNDNLIQAIVLRLSTKKGTMPLHPDYGNEFHSLLGSRLTYDLLNKLQVYIRKAINEEPRVKDNSVKVSSKDGQTVDVEVHVNPIDAEEQLDIALNLASDGSIILK